MNGEIAQMVALVCYGNASLRGLKRPEFFSSNSTFKFCDRVNFVEPNKIIFGITKEKKVAESPDAWFEYLKRLAVHGLRLSCSPRNDESISDRMSSAFAGGGSTWILEACLPGGRSSYWQSRWDVWNQQAPERKIWRVTYGRVAEGDSRQPTGPPLDLACDELRESLEGIRAFSIKHGCGFTDCFSQGIDQLNSSPAAIPSYHPDLAPDSVLSVGAKASLQACQHAWVFGGMGSWNDLSFDGEEGRIYDQVSERLFRAINQAIAVATNDSFHSR